MHKCPPMMLLDLKGTVHPKMRILSSFTLMQFHTCMIFI